MATGGVWAIHDGSIWTAGDGQAFKSHRLVGEDPFVFDPLRMWTTSAGPGSTVDPGGAQSDVLHIVVNRTTDGGRAWQPVAIPGNYRDSTPVLSFLDSRRGYLLTVPDRGSGALATLLRTTDGGLTWHVAGVPTTSGSLLVVSDPSTIWIGAQDDASPISRRLLTVSRDGGRSWHDVALPGFDPGDGGGEFHLRSAPIFTDARHGVIAIDRGDGLVATVLRTQDGGRTWRRSGTFRPSTLASGGLAVVDSRTWLLSDVLPAEIHLSSDDGAHWTTIQGQGLPATTIDWLAFSSPRVGDAVLPSGDSPAPETLFVTGDGGRTWRPAVFQG